MKLPQRNNMNIHSVNKSAFGGPPACGKCHKPPFSPCMYNHVPDPGPKICPCKCHQANPVQLVDVSIAKVDQTAGDIKTKPEVDVGMEEKAEVKQARCDCQWLPWLHKCYGHCLKTVKPVPAQLVDVLIAKVEQTTGDIKIKPMGEVPTAEDAEVVKSKTRSARSQKDGQNHKMRAIFHKCPYIRAPPYLYGRLGHNGLARTSFASSFYWKDRASYRLHGQR